jgi:hypothetical protein
MSAWKRSTWVPFLILLMIGGCSSQKPSSPSTPTLSPTVTSTPVIAFPVGSFTNGAWSWVFKADGTFVSSGPKGSETGTYSVKGDQVFITCQCCGSVQGTYSWTFDGLSLKLAVIDDKCTNRKIVVDASTWSKGP